MISFGKSEGTTDVSGYNHCGILLSGLHCLVDSSLIANATKQVDTVLLRSKSGDCQKRRIFVVETLAILGLRTVFQSVGSP